MVDANLLLLNCGVRREGLEVVFWEMVIRTRVEALRRFIDSLKTLILVAAPHSFIIEAAMDLQEAVNLHHSYILKTVLTATISGIGTGLGCGLSPLLLDNQNRRQTLL